jgi:hypothetical protein
MSRKRTRANAYHLTSELQLLPAELRERVHRGFSIEQMQDLCDGKWSLGGERAPWLYWDTELYSQGDLLRALVGWPTWLPIPVSGDHGTMPAHSYWPRGHVEGVRTYLTASPLKKEVVSRPLDLEVQLIYSPWQEWIRRRGVRLSGSATGTLAFVPHLLPGEAYKDGYIPELLGALTALPREYHPIVACLHVHEVRSGLAETIADAGIPVVSAGHPSHPHYFHRWVEIARQFKYGTSPTPGSELIHFKSLGGSYFTYGPVLRTDGAHASSRQAQNGQTVLERALDDSRERLIAQLFPFPPDDVDEGLQNAFVEYWSLAGHRLTGREIRRLFLRDLRFVRPAYWLSWLKYVREITTKRFKKRLLVCGHLLRHLLSKMRAFRS